MMKREFCIYAVRLWLILVCCFPGMAETRIPVAKRDLLPKVSLGKDSLKRDSLPGSFSGRLPWRMGLEIAPASVLPTNSFVKGDNVCNQRVNMTLTTTLRGDFSFNPRSRWGMLYPDAYQGIGMDVRTLFAPDLLGVPVSLYIFQGNPFKHFSRSLWLGYEWRFGAAFGWADRNGDYYNLGLYNAAISTRVTAHMGVSLKLYYQLADRWQLSAGLDASHFSNGNTNFPNSGINTFGASVGVSYLLNGNEKPGMAPEDLMEEANRKRWMWDILAYGAWRKRHIVITGVEMLCKGKYGLGGIQFSPLRKINRYFNVGGALDLQFDSSAGLAPYRTGGYNATMTFAKVPFWKQVRIGVGAVAEFEMPIFAVSAGLGVDVKCPNGDKPFYQLLTLKAFLTRNLYLNAGYRLGNFKDPQNLMLGVGVRL